MRVFYFIGLTFYQTRNKIIVWVEKHMTGDQLKLTQNVIFIINVVKFI